MRHVKKITNSELKSRLECFVNELKTKRDVALTAGALGFLSSIIFYSLGNQSYSGKIFIASLIPACADVYYEKRIEANEIYLRCMGGDDEEN